MLPTIPTVHRTAPTTMYYPVQNVNSPKVENRGPMVTEEEVTYMGMRF